MLTSSFFRMTLELIRNGNLKRKEKATKQDDSMKNILFKNDPILIWAIFSFVLTSSWMVRGLELISCRYFIIWPSWLLQTKLFEEIANSYPLPQDAKRITSCMFNHIWGTKSLDKSSPIRACWAQSWTNMQGSIIGEPCSLVQDFQPKPSLVPHQKQFR